VSIVATEVMVVRIPVGDNDSPVIVGASVTMKESLRKLPTRAALLSLVVALGRGSRRYPQILPGFLASYAGDILWAQAAFLLLGLIIPSATTRRVAIISMAFSALVAVSQLYHAPWIDSIRRTTLGGLALGHGFLWSDPACYAVEIGLGILIERIGLPGRRVPET